MISCIHKSETSLGWHEIGGFEGLHGVYGLRVLPHLIILAKEHPDPSMVSQSFQAFTLRRRTKD